MAGNFVLQQLSMKNIHVFFWISFAVKILLFTALNSFLWEIKSFNTEQVLLYIIAALIFAVLSFLKFRRARTFGKYLKLLEYEFSFMLISAISFKDFGFGVVALFTIVEWQFYLKEFCYISPNEKFDGDEIESSE